MYLYPVGASPKDSSRRFSPPACRTSTSRCNTLHGHCCAACDVGGDGDRFLERIAAIRRADANAAFRSSFILGYPGETEDDQRKLLDFIEAAQLDWAGFFTFSSEVGTYANDLDQPVAHELALERLREVSELQDTITARKRDELVGTRQQILVDAPGVGRSVRECPEIDGVVIVRPGPYRGFDA